MEISKSLVTPFQIIEAIKNLNDAERETLAILADEKLSEQLMQRRKQALFEMKNGTLISEEALFRDV